MPFKRWELQFLKIFQGQCMREGEGGGGGGGGERWGLLVGKFPIKSFSFSLCFVEVGELDFPPKKKEETKINA